MRDYLIDLVRHTQGLGFIDTVKVVGTAEQTRIVAVADDKSVVIMAELATPVAEFEGTFGMPNLGKLSTILNLPVYDEKTNIAVDKKNGSPASINFESAAGDFRNEYRLQAEAVIKERVPDIEFKGVKWHVDIVPTRAAVTRMKWQSQVNNDETVFVVRTTDDNNLEFVFGDPSTHAGRFIFSEGITGKLSRQWAWPIGQVLAILNLEGDMTASFSDNGAMQINVDTGLVKYTYILPAQSK